MSRVVQDNGAQVLPPTDDQQATVSAWSAVLVCNADVRAKSAAYRQLASDLVVLS